MKKIILLSLIILLLYSLTLNAMEYNYEIELNKKLEQLLNQSDLKAYFQINLSNEDISLEALYLKYNNDDYQLITGRKNLKQGPGYFSQLMLAESAPSLNIIKFTKDYESFIGEEMVTFLGEGINKQLFTHRLIFEDIIPNLKFSVSEAMMASKNIHPLYYMPYPFWPYYLTKKIIGINNIYDEYTDNYIGADFTYTFSNNAKIYGELLVDEYPMVSYANNPDERAHLLGIYYPLDNKSNIRMEYSNVFNYVYIHRTAQNNYTYNGELIGHWLGPDADVFDIQYEHKISDKENYTFGLSYIRKGIGNLNTDFDGDHSKKFLSEITERELLFKINYINQLKDNIIFNIKLETGKAFIDYKFNKDIFRIYTGLEVEL